MCLGRGRTRVRDAPCLVYRQSYTCHQSRTTDPFFPAMSYRNFRTFPVHLALLLPGLAILAGCGGSSEPLNPGKVTAFVSVPPQATIVRAIGGDHVVVETLAGAGKDPHDFSPSTRQTVDLGRAEVWFTTRMPFERGMKQKVGKNAKRLKIVDITEGAPEFPESQPASEHGHEDAHDPIITITIMIMITTIITTTPLATLICGWPPPI